jgi:hypothetical protein
VRNSSSAATVKIQKFRQIGSALTNFLPQLPRTNFPHQLLNRQSFDVKTHTQTGKLILAGLPLPAKAPGLYLLFMDSLCKSYEE